MNATAAESRVEEEILQPAEAETTGRVAEAEEERNPENNLTESLVDDQMEVEESAEEEIVAENEEANVDEQDAEGNPTVTTRSGRSIRRPVRYMQVTKVSKENWKMEASTIAIEAELRMLLKELKALRCVRRASIKAGTKILKSHMFVVEKY
ncbi:MAG: hypothetical protein ACK53Y_28385, partial [bacterium]